MKKRVCLLIVAILLLGSVIFGVSGCGDEYELQFMVEDTLYTQMQSHTTEVNMPTAPKRLGYSFEGWSYRIGDRVVPLTGQLEKVKKGKIVVHSTWTKISYKLTYVFDGEVNVNNPSTYTVESTCALQAATKAGHVFKGWYTDKEYKNPIESISLGTTGDMVLYARFERVTYKITYELNGGTLDGENVIEWTYGDKPVTLLVPSKGDREFLGWYDNKMGAGEARVEIGSWVTCDTRLYAIWQDGTAGLTFVEFENGYKVSGYTGTGTAVVIPEWVKGKAVVGISNEAFQSLFIKQILLPKTIKRIEKGAFSKCFSLENVMISPLCGDLVIEDKAFWGCSKLRTIDLSPVVEIGEFAFQYCSALEKVTLSELLKVIKPYAFSDCVALQLTLPTALLTIGEKAFYHSGLAGELIVPKSVIEIGVEAFASCGLITRVKFQESTLDFTDNRSGYGLFSGCTALVKVELPSVICRIPYAMFLDCSSLSDITVPQSVTSIEANAFASCSALKGLNLPDGLTSVEYGAFKDCSQIETLVFPQGVQVIGSSAMSGCSQLKSVSLPRRLTRIEPSLLKDCIELQTVDFGENSELEWIGDSAFYNSGLSSIRFPIGLKTIDRAAFSVCGALQQVEFDENGLLSSLGEYVFRSCELLGRVTLPRNLKSIGKYAFAYSGLTDLTIRGDVAILPVGLAMSCKKLMFVDTGSGVQYVSEKAFSGCSELVTVRLSDNLQVLGKFAFEGCGRLATIDLPSSLKVIENEAFWLCRALTEVRMNTKMSKLESIGEKAFCSSSIATFELPNRVERLGSGAFLGCINLSQFTFAEKNKVTVLPTYLFMNCEKLSSLSIPDNVECIENEALPYTLKGLVTPFIGRTNGDRTTDSLRYMLTLNINDPQVRLQRLVVTRGVSLGNQALWNCSYLVEVSLPLTLVDVGKDVFKDCHATLVINVAHSEPPKGWDKEWLGGKYLVNFHS